MNGLLAIIADSTDNIEKIIIICGHYKGVDQRVIDKYVTHEYSVGDFVLSCGEIPALMIIDSIDRWGRTGIKLNEPLKRWQISL